MKEGKFQPSSTKKPSKLGAPSFSSYGNQVVHLSELEQISRIGSSSRGTVYKVIHRPTGKFYALKVIYGNPTESYHQISREIDTHRNVDNPNMVQCHDIFYLDHNCKIHVLSELMDKGSLEGRHIPNEKNLTGLTRQLLQGLANLHDLGYVHRDIKPSNLLINSRKKVKIADFGVSQILAQSMDCYLLVGKIPYMSPERINPDINQGQRDSYPGDIWSLGVCILEFYLGRFPFPVGRKEDLASLMCAICMSQPPEAPLTASREFRDFIACCLQKEPSKRWTAKRLLRHPFISQCSSTSTSSSMLNSVNLFC